MMRERLSWRGVILSAAALDAALAAEAALDHELHAVVAIPQASELELAAEFNAGGASATTAWSHAVRSSSAPVAAAAALSATARAWIIAACVVVIGGSAASGTNYMIDSSGPLHLHISGGASVSAEVVSAGIIPEYHAPDRSSSSSVVPEPASLSLLALGALALRRNRRR
jgi:hypothetical protein